jgi:hypothetical protein
MSTIKLTSIGRAFDRTASVFLVALGVLLAGAFAVSGV